MIPLSTKSRQTWRTPERFYDYCAFRFGPFTLDAAADKHNTKCERFYGEADNGLEQSWAGHKVWCNPPYARGSADAWLAKALRELKENGTESCVLLPANTSAKWFHEIAYGKASIYFVKGRLNFDDTTSAPFSSALYVFDKRKRPILSRLDFKREIK